MSKTRYVPIAQVKAMLEEAVLNRDEELVLYEQKLALDHAQRTAKLPLEDSLKLIEALQKSENVDQQYAVKLADPLPTETEDVRAVFQKERYQLDTEEVRGILDTVAKFI